MIARIDRIDWFRHCGEPCQLEIAIPFKQVKKWKAAFEHCSKSRSENARLEARNAITQYLHDHHREQYGKWSEIVEAAKSPIVESIYERIDGAIDEYAKDEYDLYRKFFMATRWNLVAAMMEDAYKELLPQSSLFFHELLTVYEAGHAPCGWSDQNWPKGTLVVF